MRLYLNNTNYLYLIEKEKFLRYKNSIEIGVISSGQRLMIINKVINNPYLGLEYLRTDSNWDLNHKQYATLKRNVITNLNTVFYLLKYTNINLDKYERSIAMYTLILKDYAVLALLNLNISEKERHRLFISILKRNSTVEIHNSIMYLSNKNFKFKPHELTHIVYYILQKPNKTNIMFGTYLYKNKNYFFRELNPDLIERLESLLILYKLNN